jgi:hypothetical protein
MVSRLKCPQCGLVNFGSATECKRCHFRFDQPAPRPDVSSKAETVSTVGDQLAPDLSVEDSALREPDTRDDPPTAVASSPEYFDDEPAAYTLGTIIFAITVVLSVVLAIYQLREYSSLYGGEGWKVATNLQSATYVPNLEPIYYLGWILKSLMLLASVLLLLPFMRKSFAFLWWVRVYLIANFIYLLVDGLAVLQMEAALREKPLGKAFATFTGHLHWYLYLDGIALLATFIWFGYFTTSKRAAQTFIN